MKIVLFANVQLTSGFLSVAHFWAQGKWDYSALASCSFKHRTHFQRCKIIYAKKNPRCARRLNYSNSKTQKFGNKHQSFKNRTFFSRFARISVVFFKNVFLTISAPESISDGYQWRVALFSTNMAGKEIQRGRDTLGNLYWFNPKQIGLELGYNF